MDTIEKIDWLTLNTCELSININEHHGGHEPIEDAVEGILPGHTSRRFRPLADDVKAECIRLDRLVVVYCYPDTPISFICLAHHDFEQAVDAMYCSIRSLFESRAANS